MWWSGLTGGGGAASGAAAGAAGSGGYGQLAMGILGRINQQKQQEDPQADGQAAPQATSAAPQTTSGKAAAGLRGLTVATDKIGQAFIAPQQRERQNILDTADAIPGTAEGIHPVASSRGGIEMAKALEENSNDMEQSYARHRYGILNRQMRQTNAIHDTAQNGAAIVARIASMFAGGGGGGGGAGAAAGGGMGGI